MLTVEETNEDGQVESSEKPELSREEARNRMLNRMRAGIPLGGPPYPKRDEIYDRSKA